MDYEQLTCICKFVRCASRGHEPLAPVYGLPVVNGLFRAEQIVEKLIEILQASGSRAEGGIAAFGINVSCGPAFALVEEHLRPGRTGGGARGRRGHGSGLSDRKNWPMTRKVAELDFQRIYVKTKEPPTGVLVSCSALQSSRWGGMTEH